MEMIIEEFNEGQASGLSKLIYRNLLEINSKYYPADTINYLLYQFTKEMIIANSKKQHIYVAIINGDIVGTGGLANFGNEEEPMYFAVAMFIKPELHGNGIGTQILHRIEEKAKGLGANRIFLRAAKGSEEFYKKQGYSLRIQKIGKANIDVTEMDKEL